MPIVKEECSTVFQFSNIHLLWSFAQTLKSKAFDINTTEMTLACDCREGDIENAVSHFGASYMATNQL